MLELALVRAHDLAAKSALELEFAWGRTSALELAAELERAWGRAGEPVAVRVGRRALEGQ